MPRAIVRRSRSQPEPLRPFAASGSSDPRRGAGSRSRGSATVVPFGLVPGVPGGQVGPGGVGVALLGGEVDELGEVSVSSLLGETLAVCEYEARVVGP